MKEKTKERGLEETEPETETEETEICCSRHVRINAISFYDIHSNGTSLLFFFMEWVFV